MFIKNLYKNNKSELRKHKTLKLYIQVSECYCWLWILKKILTTKQKYSQIVTKLLKILLFYFGGLST